MGGRVLRAPSRTARQTRPGPARQRARPPPPPAQRWRSREITLTAATNGASSKKWSFRPTRSSLSNRPDPARRISISPAGVHSRAPHRPHRPGRQRLPVELAIRGERQASSAHRPPAPLFWQGRRKVAAAAPRHRLLRHPRHGVVHRKHLSPGTSSRTTTTASHTAGWSFSTASISPARCGTRTFT